MFKKALIILSMIFTINISFANTSADDIRKQISDYAMNYIDTPYRWGSNGPNSFDCSGFVNYIYQNIANINLPRISSDISTIRQSKKTDNLLVGDLMFFKTTKKNRISHVGIYIGNGKFIHASSGHKKVIISSIKEGYYKKTFKWAINPFEK